MTTMWFRSCLVAMQNSKNRESRDSKLSYKSPAGVLSPLQRCVRRCSSFVQCACLTPGEENYVYNMNKAPCSEISSSKKMIWKLKTHA